jgi:hypothetical protein
MAMAGMDTNQLSWLEILGLREPEDGEWTLVRAAQLRELSGNSLLPMSAVLLATISAFIQFWGTVPRSLMMAWLVLLIATTISIFSARAHNLAREGGARRADLMRAVTNCAILGFFWSVPPLFYAQYGNLEQILTIAAFSLALMGAAALMLTAVPLAGMVLSTLIGLSLSFMLFRLGFMLLSGLAVSYTLCLAHTILTNGRAVITRLRNDITLDEQRDMVNLLLRQEDVTTSDWIWQIDSRKCITDPSPRFAMAAAMEPELRPYPYRLYPAGPNLQRAHPSRECRWRAALVEDIGRPAFARQPSCHRFSRRDFRRDRPPGRRAANAPHGPFRYADRLAKSRLLQRAATRPHCQVGRDQRLLRLPDDRSRSVQIGQRHAGPPDRRQAARTGRQASRGHIEVWRQMRTTGRRRICDDHRR